MTEEQPSIVTEYRGYKIAYNTFQNTWQLDISNGNVSKPSLSELQQYINDMEKKDFVRFEAYLKDWTINEQTKFTKFSKGTVTSIDNKGQFWISTPKGRSLQSKVYVVDFDNDNRIERFLAAEKEIVELQKKKDVLFSEIKVLGV